MTKFCKETGVFNPQDVQVRIGRGREAIQLLDERWDDLVMKQPAPNPTLSSPWLREMALKRNGTPLIIVVDSKDGLLAGGAFSLIRKGGQRGVRIATWLGGNGRPMILPDILVAPEASYAGELVFKRLIRDEAHAVWLLPTLQEGAAAVSLRSVAPWMYSHPFLDTWIVSLPPPKLESFRKKVNYRLRRARRLGSSIEVIAHSNPSDIASALDRLFHLHKMRWRERNDVSSFSEAELYRAWHRRAVAAMASVGNVRIIETLEDGKLVASLLGLLCGRGSMFHTPATSIGGQLRGPGHVTMLAWIEEAMKSEAKVLLLGGGSGEPEGPKGSLGPTMHDCGSLLAGRTPGIQRLILSSIRLRNKFIKLRNRSNRIIQSRPKG
ncbi:GNAT family N-acetyltransferase [Acidobacteriota bacterium]